MFNWNAQFAAGQQPGQRFPMQNPQQMQMMGYPAQTQAVGFNQLQFQQWGQQPMAGMMPMMGQQMWHQQPFAAQGHMRMGMMPHAQQAMGFVAPTPPTLPAPEERPPLPSEPPPPLPSTPHEKPPLPSEQPKPPLPGQQAFSGPSQDGPRPPDGPAPPKPAPPPDPELLAELDKVNKEEEVFLEQYKQWKQQYDEWREQNQNHPNKDQFEQYLDQWKTYEGQMESRKKSISEKKKKLEDELEAHQQSFNEPEPAMLPQHESQPALDPNMLEEERSHGYDDTRGPPRDKHYSNLSGGAGFTQSQPQLSSQQEGDGDDMDLDDEEESGAGGIIESSSHPPEQQQQQGVAGDDWETDPHKPWFSQQGQGYGNAPPIGGPRFPGRGQPGWNPSGRGGPHRISGPGGRGRGEWGGAGPRFGWRGGGASQFRGPAPDGVDASWEENGGEAEGTSHNTSYHDGRDTDDYNAGYTEGGEEEEDYTRDDYNGYGSSGGSFQRFGSRGRGRGGRGGQGYPPPLMSIPIQGGADLENKGRRGRATGGIFNNRGRGGELQHGRGRGLDLEDEEEGLGAGRGRGSHSYRGRGLLGEGMGSYEFGDDFTDSARGRGRGGWGMRGTGRGRDNFGQDYDRHQLDDETTKTKFELDRERYGDFDDVEHQAKEQYDDAVGNQEYNDGASQWGYNNRGRGSMARRRGGIVGGRGRGGFNRFGDDEGYSYNEEEGSQDLYGGQRGGFGGRGRGLAGDDGDVPGFGRGQGENDESARWGGGRGARMGVGKGRGNAADYGQEGRTGPASYGRGFEAGFNYAEAASTAVGFEDGYGAEMQGEEDGDGYPTSQTYGAGVNRGRGQGTFAFGVGRGSYGGAQQFGQYGEEEEEDSRWGSAGLGGRGGLTRGGGRGHAVVQDYDWRSGVGYHDEDRNIASSQVGNEDKSLLLQQRSGAEDDGPERKRSRFDTDDRSVVQPPIDRLLPARDEYDDPYGDLDRFGRFGDPYRRDPFYDPYGSLSYDRREYDLYGRYDRPMPERKSFMPAESIDYGHGGLDAEKKKAAIKPAEVIDYGHGQTTDTAEKERSSLSLQRDRFSVRGEDRLQGSRFGEETHNYEHGRAWSRGRDNDVEGRDSSRGRDSNRDLSRDDGYGRGTNFDEDRDHSGRSGQRSGTRFSSPTKRGISPENSLNDAYERGGSTLGRDSVDDRLRDVDDRYSRDRDRDNRYGKDWEIDSSSGRNRREDPNAFGRDSKNDCDDPYRRVRDDRSSRDRERDQNDIYGRDRAERGDESRSSREWDRRRGEDNRDKRESPRRKRLDDRYDSSSRSFPSGRDDRNDDRHLSTDRQFFANRNDSQDVSNKTLPVDGDDRPHHCSRNLLPSSAREGRDFDYGSGRQENVYGGRIDSPYRSRRDMNDRFNPYAGYDSADPNMMGRDAKFGGMHSGTDFYGGSAVSSPARNSPSLAPQAPLQLPIAEVKKVEDLLCKPGRDSRPPQLVVIIRGLPGSGKTYVSKLLREKELKFGGSAPRMLCLDDYFMVEADKYEVDPDTGKKVKRKVLEYEYEQALEGAYRQSLLKSFKKTVDDGLFPFIIMDATNEKVVHFSEFWSYAKSRGFQVYVGELDTDIATCIQRNIHQWTEWDIEKVKSNWEPLPNHYIRLDLGWLLQEEPIPEVEMEDSEPTEEEKKKGEEEEEAAEEEDDSQFGSIYKKSKWELDSSEKTLDKLDGIPVCKKHIAEHQSMNDYLQLDEPDQLDDDYFSRESLPGKKRVRWADLEEKKTQDRRRDLGFIVGQTKQDWERITDDDFATKALNRTKYFFKN